ncbi:MAG: signal peptide peptidase SppA [Janthinobacterium lividum]
MMAMLFSFIIKIFNCIYKLLNIVREVLLNLMLLIMICIFIWFVQDVKKHPKTDVVKTNPKVLIIRLYDSFEEKPLKSIFKHGFFHYFSDDHDSDNPDNSVFEITKKIKQAETDPSILGIVLQAENSFSSDQVVLEYFGKKLHEFKKSKKPIVAIGSSYSQSEYYLASFADKIFLLPSGSIYFNGISNTKMFLKQFLKMFKIHIHVFKIGKYKSAVEPFLRNSASKANKKIDRNVVQCKWKHFLNVIAHNRKIPVQEICPDTDEFIEKLDKSNNNFAQYALHNHLIDYIAEKNSCTEYLIKKFYKNTNNDDYPVVDIHQYPLYGQKISSDSNKISVIIANGVIGDSSDEPDAMDIPYVLSEINHAQYNDKIKAIVLRVNSPGGNTEDSELIRQKLLKLKKCKKPIVISMGDIAASGGYWISTAGDYIIAHPTTLTGSIGIFSIIPTLEKTLSLIGIHSSGVHTDCYNSFDSFSNMSIQEKKRMLLDISYGYKKFIKIVARARNKTKQYVQKIANGKVWLGVHAQKIGLVDEIGDLDLAINKAAKLAKLNSFDVIWTTKNYTISEITKNKIKTLLKQKSYNVLKTFLPKKSIDTVVSIYKKVYYICKIIKFNKLNSVCFDKYTMQ